MPELISTKPANLLADSNNPRISDEGLSQREALLAIATALSDEILALAQDIISFKSLDPSSLPIVIRAEHGDRFVVLEGNRRLTAIRALENPLLFENVFSNSVMEQIRKLSRAYQEAPIESIRCCLMEDREKAQHWIDLRHTGKNGGAGVVPWGPHEKARFLSRTREEVDTHTRLLDFLETGGYLSKEDRKRVPNAAFERLVKSKAIREKLGFSIDSEGKLHFKHEIAGISGLLHIVHDLASGNTKTGQIYSKAQRVEYASRIPTDVTPSLSQKPRPPIIQSGSVNPAKKTPLLRISKERDRLIPSDFRVRITEPRIRSMAKELQLLEFKYHPNSIAVLFRVFLELSVDFYLVNTMKKTKVSISKLKLNEKLLEVVAYLEAGTLLSRQDVAPVKSACAKNSFLATSTITMHEYIHNYLMVPTPTDLRAAWHGFEPFIRAIWT